MQPVIVILMDAAVFWCSINLEAVGIPSIFTLCLYVTCFNMPGMMSVFILVTLLLSWFTFYPLMMSKSGERDGQEICPPQRVYLELNFFELP
jgi:hypothetical protein